MALLELEVKIAQGFDREKHLIDFSHILESLHRLSPAAQSFPEMTFGCFLAFMVLLMVADWVSDAVTTLCLGLKWEPLFVGMVVVGVAGAIPELFLISSLAHQAGPEAALGALIGGSWLTLLVPLGVAALKMPLGYRTRSVSYELPLLVTALVGITYLCTSGELGIFQGLLALGAGIFYLGAQYHLGKESRYGLTAFGTTFTFGASVSDTFVRLVIGFCLMAGSSLYLGLAAHTLIERLGPAPLPMGFTIMLPFVFPEIAFALSAVQKGHSELIPGQGLNKATLILVFGTALLGLTGLSTSPNIINFIFVANILILVVAWTFLKFSSRLWKWQGWALLGLTLAAFLILWAQGYGYLSWLGLPRVFEI
jgi:Ca2+/Na+ antiporter